MIPGSTRVMHYLIRSLTQEHAHQQRLPRRRHFVKFFYYPRT